MAMQSPVQEQDGVHALRPAGGLRTPSSVQGQTDGQQGDAHSVRL